MKFLTVSIIELLPAVFGSALLTTIVTLWATRNKTKADAGLSDANSAKILVDTATELTKQMAEENRKTKVELEQVYYELENAKHTIEELQHRVEERTKAHATCMEHVKHLQERIEELTAPDKRHRNDPSER